MTKQIQTVELPEEVEKRFNDFIIKLKAQIDSVTPVMRDDYLHGWTKSFLAKELAQAQQEAVERGQNQVSEKIGQLIDKHIDWFVRDKKEYQEVTKKLIVLRKAIEALQKEEK